MERCSVVGEEVGATGGDLAEDMDIIFDSYGDGGELAAVCQRLRHSDKICAGARQFS